jgi:hypothetical protein
LAAAPPRASGPRSRGQSGAAMIDRLKGLIRLQLARNILALYGIRALDQLLPLVVVPYLARVLDADGWGLVDLQSMVGANRAFALAHLPHIAKLMAATIEAVIDHAELLLIGHVDPADARTIAACAGRRRILDCARRDSGLEALERYEGICW